VEPLAFRNTLKARDYTEYFFAGWSSPVARQAHNLKVRGSNPLPATKIFFENFDPERAIKSDEQEDSMRIEGPSFGAQKPLYY
jgi:hypothetical protein